MRFSAQNLFAGAATFLSLVSFSQAGECINGPFGSTTLVGNKDHGGYYCETGWENGVVTTGVEAWGNKWHIKGIQVSFSDGTKKMIGTATQDKDDKYHGAISWGATDTVNKAVIWRNKDKDAIVKIVLETSNGKKLEIGREWGESFNILTHSGILLGIRGGVGSHVDNLTLLFLSSSIGKAEITGLKFKENLDEWNKKQTGIDRAFNVAEVFVVNPNKDINATYWFRNKKDLTTTKELGSQIKNAFGASVAVEVGGKIGIPFFAEGSLKVTTTASYAYEDVRTSNTVDTGTYTVQWEQTANIGPGRAVHCKATAQTGTFDSDYVSTVKITLADGKTFEITQPGSFKSTGWASATSSCKDIDAKDAPSGSLIAKRDMNILSFIG